MQTLRQPQFVTGILTLQEKLRDAGFEPGPLDGIFGPATEAALVAFQHMKGLPSDGLVNSRTAEVLGLDNLLLEQRDLKAILTLPVVARMFPGATIDPIKVHLPEVLDALTAFGIQTVGVALVALATIRAEVGNFLPISERQSKFNTSSRGKPFDLYDNRKDLGNQGPPDGSTFRGRGYVQLTGRANYMKFGPLAGVDDLISYPAKANYPDVAARILAAFVSTKEREIERAIFDGNLANARRLVNGGTSGLDQFSESFVIGKNLAAMSQQLPPQIFRS